MGGQDEPKVQMLVPRKWPRVAPGSCPHSSAPLTPMEEACAGTHLGGGGACKGCPEVSGLARPRRASRGSLAWGDGAARSRAVGPLALLWGTPGDPSELGALVRGFW